MTTTLDVNKLDMRKELILDIKKNKGLEGQKAQVTVCLDYSGSMKTLYTNGTVQTVMERLLPVAMAFDDNQEIDFYLFSNRYWRLAGIKLSNLADYVTNHIIGKYDMSATSYAPVLKALFDDFTSGGSFLGFGKKRKQTLDLPVYNIFITDGNCDDKSNTEEVIRDMSKYGIFNQFVGIGYEQFMFLDKLDNLSGREIDNANFFKVQNIGMETDASLYDKLLTEFPSWIQLARAKGMIR